MRDLLCYAGGAGCLKLLYFQKSLSLKCVCYIGRQKSSKVGNLIVHITGQLLPSKAVSIQFEYLICELSNIYLFKTAKPSHSDSSGSS